MIGEKDAVGRFIGEDETEVYGLRAGESPHFAYREVYGLHNFVPEKGRHRMSEYELVCPECGTVIYCEECPAVEEMKRYAVKLDVMEAELKENKEYMAMKFQEYETEIANLRENMCSFTPDLIKTLTKLVNEKDSYTHAHSDRVVELSMAIAGAMKITGSNIQILRRAARLHDIGKLWVASSILKKPGKLTPEEYEEIKQHPARGVEILASMKIIREILDVIFAHHERWDGKGYPRGLKGEQIPLLSRIIAVADSIDAMQLKRVYRESKDNLEIREELKREAGKQFDPQIVDAIIEANVDFGMA